MTILQEYDSMTLPSADPWASDIIGGIIFWVGWVCEGTADLQKLIFKRDPANKGKFICTGLLPVSCFDSMTGCASC